MEKAETKKPLSEGILDQIHRCDQEILDAFVEICRENGFRYYLAGGTLLGAVRHKGPIPWDDDVDIYMPRADADAFKALMLSRPEGELYHIQCFENEPTFCHFNIHFNKRGTVYKTEVTLEQKRRYMELWIDIFPLDECRGMDGIWKRLIGRFIIFLKNEIKYRGVGVGTMYPLKQLCRLFLMPFSDERLRSWMDRLMRKDRGRQCDYYANWTGLCPFPNNVMPKSWFEPACELPYMGKKYRAPGEWDRVLTARYGNYMQLPSESERRWHYPLEVKV